MLNEEDMCNKLISEDCGVYIRTGKYAGSYINICKHYRNTITGNEYFKMSCDHNNTEWILLSVEDINILKNYKPFQPIFVLQPNGNIVANLVGTNNKLHLKNFVLNNIDKSKMQLEFINGNKKDLRRENIKIIEREVPLESNEVIIETDDGILVTNGRYTGSYKNFCYLIKNVETGDEYYKMSCNETNTVYTLLSKEDVLILKNYKPKRPIFSLHSNGYQFAKDPTINIQYYLHSFIMNNKEDGYEKCKNLSIDHINRNKLDNRRENLRLVNQSIQNANRSKLTRKHNAVQLPEGLTQDMMPKYINYNRECYDKEKQRFREFFRIEKHPKQTKVISGSKSAKLTIAQKLDDIKKRLYNLENDIVEEAKQLPKYYSYRTMRDMQHLAYESRHDGVRKSFIMKLKPDVPIEEELVRFNAGLYKKYPELNVCESLS